MGNTRTHTPICTLCSRYSYWNPTQCVCVCVPRSPSAPHVVSDFVPEWENVWNVFFFFLFIFLFGGEIYWRRKAYSIMYHPTTGMVWCIYTWTIHCVSLRLLNPPFCLGPLFYAWDIYSETRFILTPYWFPTHTHTLGDDKVEKEREREMSLFQRGKKQQGNHKNGNKYIKAESHTTTNAISSILGLIP